jgi:protein SCO1/2
MKIVARLVLNLACAWAAFALAGAAHAAAPRHGDAPLEGLGGALDLTADDGHPFTAERLHHQPALLFFGYTHCGTSCPVALVVARQVVSAFSVMHAPTILFVTLDPLTDDPDRLHAYLSQFDRRFVGLTGTPQQIERAADHYGVGRESRDGAPAHSARWYLLDGDGRLVRTYALSTPAEELREDAQRLSGGMP